MKLLNIGYEFVNDYETTGTIQSLLRELRYKILNCILLGNLYTNEEKNHEETITGEIISYIENQLCEKNCEYFNQIHGTGLRFDLNILDKKLELINLKKGL